MKKSKNFSEFFKILSPLTSVDGASARQGLRRLMLLRGIIVALGIPGLIVFQTFTQLFLPANLQVWLIAAIIISVGIGVWRLQSSHLISNNELFCHLLADASILVVVLVNTGGANNPLISYLLVLLAITATILPRKYVNAFALASIVVYTSFLILDLRVEQELMLEGTGHNMQQHLVGMWAIFLVSAILIALSVTQMANAIKIREINIAKSRENEIRNEQLVAIGTLAAGTAHAIGTPLSTMAVLLTELDKFNEDQLKVENIKSDISTLKQQVLRCRSSLAQLTQYYNKDKPETQEKITVQDIIDDIKEYLITVHPNSYLEFENRCPVHTKLLSNLSLRHALINIIENGIKAASEKVSICFKLPETTPTKIEISVVDDGPGIPTQVMESLGEPFISTRRESMGLGIFLANASIAQLGGQIEMFNLKLGGAKTLIKLPLSSD